MKLKITQNHVLQVKQPDVKAERNSPGRGTCRWGGRFQPGRRPPGRSTEWEREVESSRDVNAVLMKTPRGSQCLQLFLLRLTPWIQILLKTFAAPCRDPHWRTVQCGGKCWRCPLVKQMTPQELSCQEDLYDLISVSVVNKVQTRLLWGAAAPIKG